jgi:hypothetical protein
LERLDIEGRQNIRKYIGYRTHKLPINIMPVSLEIYLNNHFETWLAHQEIMMGGKWNHLNTNAVYEISNLFLERRSRKMMNGNLTLSSTIHQRAHQRDCRIYRTAIDSLDRTIDAMVSIVDDITQFTDGKTSSSDTINTASSTRVTSTLRDEALRLLRSATKAKDSMQIIVDQLRDKLQRVSNVLHYLGLHRDKIHSETLRMRQGLESTLDTADNEVEDSTTANTLSRSPSGKGFQSKMFATRSNSPPSQQHTRTQSTRYDHVINGEPIAAEAVRRQIEMRMKSELEEKKATEMDAMFDGLRVRSVTVSESYHLYSYFDNDGDAIEPSIVLPYEDELVHVHRSTNNSKSSMGSTTKGTGWRTRNHNERRKLSNVIQCRKELQYVALRVSEMSRTRLLLQTDLKKNIIQLNQKKYTHQLVQNMVEDVQTVENIEKKSKYAEDYKRSGKGNPSNKSIDALTIMTNTVTQLWCETILSTDESLAQIYLQVKATHGGGNGSGSGMKQKDQRSSLPKTMTKRQSTVHHMKSYGLLNGSEESTNMLMSTEMELKKTLMAVGNKSDPNEAYPSMLMLEMVADCTTMRIHYQLALHGHVQQCYDTSVTNAETMLPQLMPKYDLTFSEFKAKLNIDRIQSTNKDIANLILDLKNSEVKETVLVEFERISTNIAEQLKDHLLTRDMKDRRSEELSDILELLKDDRFNNILDIKDDIEYTEKLLLRLER